MIGYNIPDTLLQHNYGGLLTLHTFSYDAHLKSFIMTDLALLAFFVRENSVYLTFYLFLLSHETIYI